MNALLQPEGHEAQAETASQTAAAATGDYDEWEAEKQAVDEVSARQPWQVSEYVVCMDD